jgi:hypothetical protein
MGVHHVLWYRSGAGGKHNDRRIIFAWPRQLHRRAIAQIGRNGRRGFEQRAALGRYGGSGFDAGAQLRISARKSGREIRKRRFIDQKTRFKFAAHFGERRGGFAGMERDRQCSHPYRTEPGDEIDRARQTEQRDRHSRLGAERAEQGGGL